MKRSLRYVLAGAAVVALVAGALAGVAWWRGRAQAPLELTVTRVTPADGAAGVGLDTPVTIAFDRPAVLTDTLSAAARDPRAETQLAQPFDLIDAAAPGTPVAGFGRWLAPSLYSFYPVDGLHAASTYTVTLRAERFPGSRTHVAGPASWSFMTGSQLLVSTRPFDGATDVPVDQPIEVVLGPDVDPASAGAHFQLADLATDQAVDGAVRAVDGGFEFMPAAPLAIGASYTARLLPGITTVRGAALQYESPSWRFTTIRQLAVARFSPEDGAADVPPDTPISVTFNRPVVALPAAGDQSNLPQPLALDPPALGVGRWVAPDTYVYSPTVALDAHASYTVRVAAGLQASDSNTLGEPLEWHFKTLPFQATGVLYNIRDLSAPVQVLFSLPVDLDSLRSALSVRNLATGADVPGTLALAGRQASFTPLAPLERNTRYLVTVARNARSAGGALLEQLYSQTFTTLPLPALTSTNPKDGATNVAPGRVASGGQPIELGFSAPMNWDSLLQNLRIDPPTRVVTMTGDRLDLNLLPKTYYTITIGAGARDIYGMALGRDASFSFQTGTPQSSLELATGLTPEYRSHDPAFPFGSPRFRPARLSFADGYAIGTYSAYDPARITLRSVNISDVGYQIYRLEASQVISATSGGPKAWEDFRPDPIQRLKDATVSIGSVPDQQTLNVLDVGRLEPGLYHLLVYGPAPTFDYQMMAVSRYALTIKRSADQLFVWAVDLRSGQPEPNLPLSVSFREAGQADASSTNCDAAALKTRALGRTGADGVLQTSLTAVQLDALPRCPVYVWSEAGERFAFATTAWNRDIDVTSFGLPPGSDPSRVVGNVYTERPLYRPDQVVFLRGMVRLDRDRVYRLPSPGHQARLIVNDPRGTRLLSALLPIDETGSFSTTLPLARSAALGTYGVFVSLEGEVPPTNGSNTLAGYQGTAYPAYHFFNTFTVAEYRKPSFKVSVSPDQASLLPNTTAVFTISATYFSGQLVVGARVRWYMIPAPLDFGSQTNGDFHFGQNLDSAQNLFGTRAEQVSTGLTDRQGQLIVRPYVSDFGVSRRLAFYAEVTDAAGQVSYGQALNSSHAGAFYLGLRPAKIISRAGEAQSIDVVALDPSDRPVAGRAVRLTIAKRSWYSSSEQGSEGRFYWSSTSEDQELTTSDLSTDSAGRASLDFKPPEAGAYLLRAEAVDAAGNQVVASMLIYATGGDVFWGVDNSNQIKLIADRASYRPGDVATILIPAPYAGMTALMTIERGQVIEHHTFVISGTTGIFNLPIVADFTPNIYVSAVLIKPSGADMPVPELRAGTIELAVPIEQQILKVAITPDKPHAGPRDKVTFDINVTDANGKGVRAELALALVDQSLLELVKALSKNPTPTYTDGFFSRRLLGVETSNTLVQLVDRVTLRIQPGVKGGAGGGVGGVIPGSTGILDELLLRRDFRDTAYWNPALMTDDSGHASVTVNLPDNLTTWRLVARALTADTRFGQATSDVTVSRDLFIQPIVPTALILGDRLTIRALVQRPNGTTPLDAVIRLDAGGLQLEDPAERTVQMPSGDRESLVEWRATAATAGQQLLRFSVRGGGAEDLVEQPLPVVRYAPPDVTVGAGQIFDQAAAPLRAPNPAQTASGRELIVDLVPSLGAAIASAQQALDRNADGSTEQIVSSFLPRLAADRVPGLAGAALQTPDAERGLPARLQQLYRQQNLDGGWGWWSQDGMSQPYLSAYVLQGLVEARRSGYAVDEQVLGRATSYLQTSLNDFALDGSDSAPWRRNARSYVLFVLAEAGKTDLSRTVALYDQRERLGTYGRAYLLMTLLDLGGESERARTLLSELVGSAVPRADGVYWAEPSADLETMSSNTRSTALALQAIVRADPANLLLPYALRGLMSQRAGDGWRSSQETSAALLALAEYSARSSAGAPKYSYQVELGSRTLLSGSVGDANSTQPISATVELTSAGGQLTLRREAGWLGGRGDLFYQLRVRSYGDVRAIAPLDHGLRIERSYLSVDQTTLESGNLELREAEVGQLVLVRLKLTVPLPARFLAIEDPLPAGLEPLDIVPRSSTDLQRTLRPGQGAAAADPQFFDNVEIRRNRVTLSATSIPSGTYYYSYLARATTPGDFQAPPASVSQVYAPDVAGSSAGAQFSIHEASR